MLRSDGVRSAISTGLAIDVVVFGLPEDEQVDDESKALDRR